MENGTHTYHTPHIHTHTHTHTHTNMTLPQHHIRMTIVSGKCMFIGPVNILQDWTNFILAENKKLWLMSEKFIQMTSSIYM